MYREALSLVTASPYVNRLTENSLSEKTLKADLVSLEKGTRFDVGKFSYSDYYTAGGNTAVDTGNKTGLTLMANWGWT